MRILISGSTGMVGTGLVSFLTAGGHEVVRLVRSRRPGDERSLLWDPRTGPRDDPARLEGFDAVIHLAGENIAAGRWSAAQKRRIEESRVLGTRVLADALARCERKPEAFLCASATGFYGDRGDEVLDEMSPPGQGFLPRVAEKWEAASQAATEAGIRVVSMRFGMILSPEAGALGKMLPAFKLGLGGRLGTGNQQVSWIALDDLICAIHHLLHARDVAGPVNLVSPNPVTNREFTATLARVLGRPKGPPAPPFMLRLALGEMADELLLAGARVKPARLLDSGYEFQYPDLEAALRHLLGRERHFGEVSS